jgi:hypothetical protein
MKEGEILRRSNSEPDAKIGQELEYLGDFNRTILLMSLETELRVFVRKKNATRMQSLLSNCISRPSYSSLVWRSPLARLASHAFFVQTVGLKARLIRTRFRPSTDPNIFWRLRCGSGKKYKRSHGKADLTQEC